MAKIRIKNAGKLIAWVIRAVCDTMRFRVIDHAGIAYPSDEQRIWIFWRRLLHTAHHRTQLTVYLRMLDKPVPSTYGPTADVTWTGADPTTTVEAASRR